MKVGSSSPGKPLPVVAYRTKLLKSALTKLVPLAPARQEVVAPYEVSMASGRSLGLPHQENISQPIDAAEVGIGDKQRTIFLCLRGIATGRNGVELVKFSRRRRRAIVEEENGEELAEIVHEYLHGPASTPKSVDAYEKDLGRWNMSPGLAG